jgi:hypothetical protein
VTDTQGARIQSLLAAPGSPLRERVLRMTFDHAVGQPLSIVIEHPELADAITNALVQGNVERVARRHVMPAVTRVQERLGAAQVTVRDFLSDDAEAALRALVASGRGPRFVWMRGAIDPADLQKLITPIVQQVLTSFVTKLPIPGLSGSGKSPSPSTRPPGPGGLVGMIGKQVAKGASQLAGGLGLQQIVKDFSQSAAAEIRGAIVDRLKSEEGREILLRIRDRVLDRVLGTRAGQIVDDFLRVSPAEVARIAEGAVSHTRTLPVFREILAGEIRATMAELGARSVRDVLEEAHLLEAIRTFAIATLDPAVAEMIKSEAFGDWLGELLVQTGPAGGT